jgi:regulator of extracellular matrix RemA (YlzA/DUF370 family)
MVARPRLESFAETAAQSLFRTDLVGCFGNVVAGNIAVVAFKDPELIHPIARLFYEAGQKMSAGQYINAMLEMHSRSRAIVQSLTMRRSRGFPTPQSRRAGAL